MSPSCRRSVGFGLALILLLAPGAPAGAAAIPAPGMPLVESYLTVPAPVPPGPPVSLENVLSYEEAMARFIHYAPTLEGRAELEAHLEEWGPLPTWTFQFATSEPGGWSWLHLGSIDAQTGQLLQLDLTDPRIRPLKEGPAADPYPEAFAQAWASSLVREIYPDEFLTMRMVPTGLAGWGYTPSNTYLFTWTQYNGDIAVPFQTVMVGLDKETLQFVWFVASFLDVPLSDTLPTVSPEEALAVFRGLGMELAYIPTDWSPEAGTAFRLVYRAPFADYAVNAVTGALLDPFGRQVKNPGPGTPVPADEAAAIRPESLPLTEETALAFARLVLELEPEALLEVSPGSEGFNISSAGYETGVYSYLTLDSRTGLIRNAHRWYAYAESDESLPEVTDESVAAARDAAIATVQRLYGEQAGDLRLATRPFGYQSAYSFYFQRHVHSIPVEHDGIQVNIDPSTLEWTDISATWTQDADFAQPVDLISSAEAEEAYFSGREVTAVYWGWHFNLPYTLVTHEPVEPAYILTPTDAVAASSVYVDAQSGPLLDFRGRPANWLKQLEQTLDGHWAESALRYAIQTGALDWSEVDPDAVLTWDQARRLLSDGLRDRTLPEWEVDLNRPISRAEFATVVARVLKLGKLADSSLVTLPLFTDLTLLDREQQNAVAFLEALGIVRSTFAFRPDDPLTQAEGAVILVRLLNHLWHQ